MTAPSDTMVGGVVSLVPSITETLLAWGVDVAACTRFCEQPHLVHVGGTKNPDIDAIVALRPRVVLMDSEENRREDFDELTRRGTTVVATDVHAVADVGRALETIAEAIGRPTTTPTTTTATVTVATVGERRRAIVPIWRRPWMVIGPDTYGASLLASCGIDVVSAGDDRYPCLDPATWSDLDPDLVVVPSEPYEFDDRHLQEMHEAVPDAQICRVDGRDLFWWGVRTADAHHRLVRQITG